MSAHPARKAARRAALALLASALLLAPGLATPAAAHHVRDATGRLVEVRDTAHIVAIGSAVTEILFALGVGERVVAVDQTSTYPEAARKLPNVGYSRALSPEGVLSKTPSLIIAIEGAGPREAIEVLEHSSVPVVIVPDGHSAEGVIRKIEMVAAAVGIPRKGADLAAEVKADFTQLAKEVATLRRRPKAVFVLSAAGGSPVVGGSGTGADAMFRLAGIENAVSGVKGYKPAGDEVLLTAAPEAIVVMSGGGQALPADLIFSLPAFKASPAAKDKRLVTLPGSYLLGFGPRTPQAARDLALAVRGNARLAPLPAHSWSSEPNP
ncbi:heme/hemin ABC transporter substrate-binding protein [Azorhizobium doebereinerae]|uniref:heme/hemin ABC transporter substrate-binding protein n=1 Tax=Azorhizobium doebereinerae TaxID=281091 RepID=UPI00054DD3A9|nr:ABC transporter substrate-binding protein [Azorhizobium doebereinerae]